MPRAKTLPRSMPLIDFLDEKQLFDTRHLPHDFKATHDPKQIYLRKIKGRMIIAVAVLSLIFTVPCYRLVHLAMDGAINKKFMIAPDAYNIVPRGKIYDRKGFLLAGNLPTLSLVASPRNILKPNDTAQKLSQLLPYLQKSDLLKQFQDKNGSKIILAENLDPALKQSILALGEPGLEIGNGNKRFYPSSRSGAVTVGFVNRNNLGVSGLERFFNKQLSAGHDVNISIDSRVQNYLDNELAKAKTAHNASAAGGVVLDMQTGEVLGLSSLPGFDPNNRAKLDINDTFNMVTGGSYELGSVMKIVTMAGWLDQQQVNQNSKGDEPWRKRLWDVTRPLDIDGYTINDLHPIKRSITSDEVFIYSSNIGAALLTGDVLQNNKMAQRNFLQSLHLLSKMNFELPDHEMARPMVPKTWGKIESETISFGHGISLPPLQFAAAVAALVGDGVWRAPTLQIKQPDASNAASQNQSLNQGNMFGTLWGKFRGLLPEKWQAAFNWPSPTDNVADPNKKNNSEVVSAATRAELRRLLRLNVLVGSGQRINGTAAVGYEVGGKTGTAEKIINGQYSRDKNLTSFISIFPTQKPRYLVFLLLDNTSKGYLASETLVPASGRLIGAIAPLLAVAPSRAAEQRNDQALEKISHFAPLDGAYNGGDDGVVVDTNNIKTEMIKSQ
ncbi:MAG: penicillin-binding protein 2 [Hydrotalea sp.]|nr:penicillin-binding protein 2 [Hydrotalea sp.]